MSSQPKIDAFVIFREKVSRNTFYSPFPLTAPRLAPCAGKLVSRMVILKIGIRY